MDSLTSPFVQCGKGQVSVSSSPVINLVITHLVLDITVLTGAGERDDISVGIQSTRSEAGPLGFKS